MNWGLEERAEATEATRRGHGEALESSCGAWEKEPRGSKEVTAT